MPVKTSFSTDGNTAKRLKEMAIDDGRKISNFVTWLINEEWKRRHEWADSIPEYVRDVEPVASP